MKERQIQNSTKRRKVASSRFNAKQTDLEESKSQNSPDAVSIEDSKKDNDGMEAATLLQSMIEVNIGRAESEIGRIKNKLKSVKPNETSREEDVFDEGDEDEWQAAVLTKSKQQRRKPTFLF